MTPATLKHKQLILLEPAQAQALETLAAESRIPKQVLLREAVDLLLTLSGRAQSKRLDDIRETLKVAQRLVAKVRRKRQMDAEVHRACDEAGVMLADVLAQLGERKA